MLHRQQLGHVVARLIRQAKIQQIGGQAPRLVGGDGARYVALPAVVGGERQFPGAEPGVQFFQIIERRVGGGQHVAAAVVPPVLVEAEVLAGGRNELPDARCLAARIGLRIEGAFYHRQQGDFGGQFAPLHFLDNVEQIELAALGHAAEVVGLARVQLLMFLDQGRVEFGHGKAAADAHPQVVFAGWENGDLRCCGRRRGGCYNGWRGCRGGRGPLGFCRFDRARFGCARRCGRATGQQRHEKTASADYGA